MPTLTKFKIHKNGVTINYLVNAVHCGDAHIYRDVEGDAGCDFMAIDPEAAEAVAAALLTLARSAKRHNALTEPVIVRFPSPQVVVAFPGRS